MVVSAQEGHRLWAQTYDTALNPVLALESRTLADLLCPVSGGCFIDVACGTGRWMQYLGKRGACAFGVDLSAEMLAQADGKRALRGKLVLADAGGLPFRDYAADATICSFAASYFPSLKQAVAEMARITRRGGQVIVSDLHPAAISAGWTRSFRLGEFVYEMEHSNPSLDEFLAAGYAASLQLDMQVEACLGDPERPIFRIAGKEHMFAELSRVPAIWIGIWNKI